MITIAHPWAVELIACTGRFAAAVSDWVMVCVTMFASAPQNPAALCRDIEEAFAGTLGLLAPACRC